MTKYFDTVDEAMYLLVDDFNNEDDRRKHAKRIPPLTQAEKEYRSRWTSIRLIYMVTFTNYISYTATLASLWAYLKVLEPNARTSTMGWVVSAYAMGQILSGPLFGIWSNRRTIKEALVVSLLLNVLSFIFYMYLASMPTHREYYMIAARWLIGFSSASTPLSRTYIANATTVQERTPAIANTNICGAVGFILGPLLQAALVPISYPGPVESNVFHFNMYTAPILLSAATSFVAFVVIIIAFREHSVVEDIANEALSTRNDGQFSHKDLSVDYVAAVVCIVLFSCSFLNFAFLETIIVPLIMHMYAWTKARATLVQSLAIGGTALLSILVYIIIQWLCKRMRERTLFLLGCIILVLSYVVILPWGNEFPKIQIADIGKSASAYHTTIHPDAFVNTNSTATSWSDVNAESTLTLTTLMETTNIFPTFTSDISPFGEAFTFSFGVLLSNKTIPLGCPWQYNWCRTVPIAHLCQFVLCLVLFGIGYPTTNLLTISIFSKILGPKQMGLWMGILIGSGCLAGIIGPILQTIIYSKFGPRVTFTAAGAFMCITIVITLSIFKRLRPFGEGNHEHSMTINKE